MHADDARAEVETSKGRYLLFGGSIFFVRASKFLLRCCTTLVQRSNPGVHQSNFGVQRSSPTLRECKVALRA